MADNVSENMIPKNEKKNKKEKTPISKSKPKKLSMMQQKAADIYLSEGVSAAEALRRAGYSDNTARKMCGAFLEIPAVKEYVDKVRAAATSDTIATLREINEFRTRVIRGEEGGVYGKPELQDQLKACDALEKARLRQEEKEAEDARREAAMKSGVYHTDLDAVADIFHPSWRAMRKCEYRKIIEKGGRGGVKSSDIAMKIIERLKNNPNQHALVVRKVGNTLRDSVYAQMLWAIDKQAENPLFDLGDWSKTVSPMEITYKPTGQKIYFRGADDPGKIKSIKPPFGFIGSVWFEELDQFTGPEEIRNITQSAVRGGSGAMIFMSFNPPKTQAAWVNKYVIDQQRDPDTLIVSSTYLDVPQEWLGDDFIAEAEMLKEINPDAYEHEYLGVVNGNGGSVFENVIVREITDEEIKTFNQPYFGVDWGWYPDPYAMVRCYYNPAQLTLYITDEYVVNKQGNEETAKTIIEQKGVTAYDSLICDSAEAKSVADYTTFGLPNARGAIKGPDSVRYSIKWLQRLKAIVIDPVRCPKSAEEFTLYEYDRNKEGEIVSGYPDKNNHCIDATRYAMNDVWKRRGE